MKTKIDEFLSSIAQRLGCFSSEEKIEQVIDHLGIYYRIQIDGKTLGYLGETIEQAKNMLYKIAKTRTRRRHE